MNGSIEIIGTESLGVRGLSCLVTAGNKRIVIDPGVALGYLRHGLLPHPRQVAEGERVRLRIIGALESATDVVFSHFHGDHVPLREANPYQLAIRHLPETFKDFCGWSKSPDDLDKKMKQRALDLLELLGSNLQIGEGQSDGPLSFSPAMPHGIKGSRRGTVMMTRVELGNSAFLHASDIQLLDVTTIDFIIAWQADIVLAAGPPLYIESLSDDLRTVAWKNALRLAANVETLILDHHLLRDRQGAEWLDALSAEAGKRVYCAADFMGRKRLLFEAERAWLYETMPVPAGWHENYAKGLSNTDGYRS
jgi:predicted metallo-beta-lactamase superfamily hydrolase